VGARAGRAGRARGAGGGPKLSCGPREPESGMMRAEASHRQPAGIEASGWERSGGLRA